MTYDLQTLRAMLDCNRDEENKIDEKKYLHIIRAWVEHVRESKNVPQSPQQEVSESCTVLNVFFIMYLIVGYFRRVNILLALVH